MQSTVGLFNMALGRLGGHQLPQIQSPDEPGTLANLCRTFFPTVRDIALSTTPWAFAGRSAALALKPEPGLPGYPFRYALPADCLFTRWVDSGEGFTTVHLVDGRDVCCAATNVTLYYTASMPDPATWPPTFASVVAWALAAELATAAANDMQKQQYCREMYQREIYEARAIDLRGQWPATQEGPWLQARD